MATRTTTTVTELPEARRWIGRDWGKLAVATGLAVSLLRPGAGAVTPAPLAQPAAATAAPAATVASVPPAPTAGAITLPGVLAPSILSTREAPQAGPYTVRGSGSPGSTVRVTLNGAEAGTAQVDADGRWALDTTLPAGEVEIVAEAVNESGAVIAASEPTRLTVAAAAVAIEAPTIITTLQVPQAGPYTVGGGGTPGSTVRVTLNGAEVGTAEVAADGSWSLDLTLPPGEVEIVAEALDEAGAVAAASDPFRTTVLEAAGEAPAAPAGGPLAISAPPEGAALPDGPLTVSGTGSPGAALEVLSSDQVVAETTVGEDGTWSAEVDLPEGTAAISVRERGSADIAGRPIRVTVGEAEQIACATLQVGCKAFVTRAGDLVLRMRSAGQIADNVVARLPIGTELEALEGPAPADGFTWWRVRTLGGNEGWVAGENLVLQPD